MAGLGKGYDRLPSQLARAYLLPQNFALCSIANTKSNGVILFGEGSVSASEVLNYTPSPLLQELIFQVSHQLNILLEFKKS